MKKLIKKNKHFLIKVVNLCLIIGICAAYHNIASARIKKAEEIEKENQAIMASVDSKGEWKDGSYEGTGTGFGGDIVVTVTIEDGKINNVEIVSAEQEDSAYLENATSILDTMIQQQTADVDAASGATYSSNGIIEAVKNALEEAS